MTDPRKHGALHGNPGFLLAHTRLRMGRGLQKAFRDAGHEFTGEQWGLLNLVDADPGAHQTALAAMMGRDKPSMSRLLDTMEKRGYLHRRIDPEDRRSHLIELSRAGEALLAELRPVVSAYLDRIFSSLDTKDYEIFIKVLRHVGSRIDDYLNDAPEPQDADGN